MVICIVLVTAVVLTVIFLVRHQQNSHSWLIASQRIRLLDESPRGANKTAENDAKSIGMKVVWLDFKIQMNLSKTLT